ncbi:Oxa1Ec [Candidatus Rubidus massiliensis]|nr:MAG: membrane protein insertase YidC [Chlamydia sp. 32-24]CDZ81301.1 Oxa1Ec [Candidatus Rubidus massiliensis]
MDKRSLLFIIALTVLLFFVNNYFQSDHDNRTRQWLEQQKAIKEQQLGQIESQIAKLNVEQTSLPIVPIYSDSQGLHFLSNGIYQEGTILTITTQNGLPSQAFAQIDGKNIAIKTIHSSNEKGKAVIYQVEGNKPLIFKTLPDFGKYSVILIPATENGKIYNGEYIDGHFSILQKQRQQLRKDLDISSDNTLQIYDSIALTKNGEGIFPVGIYSSDREKLIPLDALEYLENSIKPLQVKTNPVSNNNQKVEEKFYVLENDYLQLVFSNYGGALSEINLPFKTKNNTLSVVREIEFDREMAKNHPYNARFPSHSYDTPGASLKDLTFHEKGSVGGYYPLIRRDLIEKPPFQSVKVTPKHYALNIVSEYPEMAELVFQVKEFTKDRIVFEAKQSHRTITKTFSLKDVIEKNAPYIIDLNITVDGDARGLWLTSGIPEVEWISGGPAPSLKYRITRNNKPAVETVDLPKDSTTISSVYPDWIDNSNGFFGIIIDPLTKIDTGFRVQQVAGTVVPSRLVEIQQEYDRFKAQNMPGYNVMLPLNSSGGSMDFRIFAGPFEDDVLKTVDKIYSNTATGYNPDYIASQTFHGWFSFISEPFANFLFVLMKFFHSISGSWALSIILLTIALRIMMYPLNAWSTKSMLAMQKIGPEVTAIQEKHKKDPKKAQLEIMNLYRERGVNPISGCLPLLLQMPFLIGMFDLLKSTFELRGASFIPGWIDDLTAPDVLFSWQTPIFFFGNEFHLLPFLLGGVMFLQQRMMTQLPKDSSQWTDQQRQQRAMSSIMPILFAVMFYNFPSGLNIYWLSSMLLGILQQWWTQRQLQNAPQPPLTSIKSKK